MATDLHVSARSSRRDQNEVSLGVARALATATSCAERGWPVHPLAPRRKTPVGNCSECRTNPHAYRDCPCPRAGGWCHGFKAATTDPGRIVRWWSGPSVLGVGVACAPAGLVVVDVDAHETRLPSRDRILPGVGIAKNVDLRGMANGFHTLGVLAALRGERSPVDDDTTLRVVTPSGGLHVWYRATDRHRWRSSVGSGKGAALAWQVDIRASGGYIVAPGTTTDNGTYRVLHRFLDPAPLPVWLAQELARTGHLLDDSDERLRRTLKKVRPAAFSTGGMDSRAQQILTSALAQVEACGAVSEGAGFSGVLNRAAYTIAGLVAAGRVLEEEAEHALFQTAEMARPGQETRARQIIRSGWAAGSLRPLHGGGA